MSQPKRLLPTLSVEQFFFSDVQKAEIEAVVKDNPNADKFICTGIRLLGTSDRMNLVVRKRAKEACDYAKELNPKLSTWYQSKTTNARSYIGRVLLVLKTSANLNSRQ